MIPDLRGACAVLKRWFRHKSVRSPNPSWEDVVKVTGDYEELYRNDESALPGITVPTHIKPFWLNYNFPLDGEVEAAVQQLRIHKAGGPSHLRAEHFKKWIWEAYPSEGTSTLPPRPKWWKNLVWITQLVWRHFDIPRGF